jgi:tetratricopeptide (TPR) repeat protein
LAASLADPSNHFALATALNHLAVMLWRRDDPTDPNKLADNRQLLQRGITQAEQAVNADASRLEYRELVLNLRENLALVVNRQGDRAGALATMRKTILLRQALAQDFPGIPEKRKDLAESYSNLADFLVEAGEDREAAAAYRLAVEVFKALTVSYPDVPAYDRELSETRLYLARHVVDCLDESVRDRAQAVALARQAITREPETWTYWDVIGIARHAASDWTGAIEAFRKAEDMDRTRTSFGWSSRWLYSAMADWHLGHQEHARRSYERADDRMKTERPDRRLARLRDEATALLGGTKAMTPEARRETASKSN